MRALYDIARTWWRRLKDREPWNRGCVARACYSVLLRGVGLLKRLSSGSDLEARALYLMYHPEVGIAPYDGWKCRSRLDVPPAELAALRERLEEDRLRVRGVLGVKTVDWTSMSSAGRPPDGPVAIHVHVFYPDVLPRIAAALKPMPYRFDLFLSVPEGVLFTEADARRVFASVSALNELTLRRCPNRGRDVAPIACVFGKDLLRYRYVAHFHTKRSPHAREGRDWLAFVLERLAGSRDVFAKVFDLLSGDYGMVAPRDFLPMPEDPAGWGRNQVDAQKLVDRAGLGIRLAERFPVILFPQGSMFWARTDFLRPFLALPIELEDFPAEPVGADGTPAHALERLFFVWGIGSGLSVGWVE